MDKIRVLLAEDESALAHIVRESLEQQNFEVILCSNGEQAFQKYTECKPDILALDVMMPKMDGFELARNIRLKDRITPILFLTAKSQAKDVVEGFESGANDYLKKPFSVEELIIRIKVLMSNDRLLERSKAGKANENFTIGNILFNSTKNMIQQGLDTWQLTSRESDILKLLCQYDQQVIARKLLLKTVWGDDTFFNARSLDVYITKLRKRMEADPNIQIINIRGTGYKLVW